MGFFPKGRKRKTGGWGPTLLLSRFPWQHLPEWGEQVGLGAALCLLGDFLGWCWGVHQRKPLSSSPARTPHACPAPAKGQRPAGERAAGGHRVSPAPGCYGGLKIARAVQPGGSIPFFQESQRRSGPACGGALFVRKALWCLPGAWM